MTKRCMHIAQIVLVSLLLLSCTIAAAAASNITITKSVSPSAVYTGDAVTWKVCVTNNDFSSANVTVEDALFAGNGSPVYLASVYASNSSGSGEFNSTTGVWTIENLAGKSNTTLTLVTRFAAAGTYTNWANITEYDIHDSDTSDNNASAEVEVKAPTDLTGRIIIKPETLNLKSRGIFHVFVNITGEYAADAIDLANSNLTCNGAPALDLKIAGAGDPESAFARIIARFNRQDLVNTSAENATIDCTGTIVVGGEAIRVEGGDEVRLIHEQRQDSFLDRILKFLGFRKDDPLPAEASTLISTLPEGMKSPGQARKYIETAATTPDPEGLVEETGVLPQENPSNGKAKGQVKRTQEQCQNQTCDGADVTPTPRGKGYAKKTAEE